MKKFISNRRNCSVKITLKSPFIVLRLGVFMLFACQLIILNGCEQFENWTNDTPEITSFTVPEEVHYGDTVEFKVTTFDPEDDSLTYLWDVSDGTLKDETGIKVQWTAPALGDEEVVPPQKVTVRVYIRDGGDEEVSESASITIFSKAYKVANALSGSYDLVRSQVNGKTVDSLGGTLRLTTTTFTRQFEDDAQFFFGAYELIEPFDDKKGSIHWFSEGALTPDVSTYTWDGKLLVIFWPDTATGHVYDKKR